MVRQCINLYENEWNHGTLIVSVDDSKYLIRFYESIKVEVLLDEDIASQKSNVSVSKSNENSLQRNSELEGFGKWGNYIDLAKLSSDQGIPKTTQKIVKAEDGQCLTITTLDADVKTSQVVDGCSETFATAEFNEEENIRNGKKRKINSEIEDQSLDNEIRQEAAVKVKNEVDYVNQNYQDSNDTDSYQHVNNEYLSRNLDDVLSPEKLLKKEVVYDDGDNITAASGTKRNTSVIHSCRDCYGTFDTSKDLKDHRKVKSTNEYQCDECFELFEYQAFLEVHKRSNHGGSGASLVYKDRQYWYSCDTCGVLAENILKLQVHNMAHTGEGIFQCCRCPQKFGERNEFRQHMKNHKLSGTIRCRWCNKWFADKGALAKHKLNCKEIKCHLCDNVFPNRTSRHKHYKDFHPNDILKCELCPYLFSSQEELEEHIVNHSKAKKKQCTLCGLFFSRLKKHMLVHKNPDDYTENEMFYCDKCPAKFTNQATFSRHRKNHLGDKPYQCPNCPRTFTNCGVLYKHIKRHKSLLPYTCEVCSKNCASIELLKTHMKSHSDDNLLFPCSLCTQSFMYRNSLEAHMQMKHAQTYSVGVANSVEESAEIGKTTHDFSSSVVTSFADNTNSLMEVVIPGISGLVDSQIPKLEVVILQE